MINLNAKVLGVSADSLESHQKFIKNHALKIDLLSDPDKKVMEAYGAFWQKVKVRVKRKDEKISHSSIVQEKLLELQNA